MYYVVELPGLILLSSISEMKIEQIKSCGDWYLVVPISGLSAKLWVLG